MIKDSVIGSGNVHQGQFLLSDIRNAIFTPEIVKHCFRIRTEAENALFY